MEDSKWVKKLPWVILKTTTGLVENLAKKILEGIYHEERKALRILFEYLLFLLAVIILIIAVIILASDYLGLNKGWSLLIIGAIILIWAIILRIKNSQG